MSSNELEQMSEQIVLSLWRRMGFREQSTFPDFPPTSGRSWCAAVDECERRTFQWILPHPPSIVSAPPICRHSQGGCVTWTDSDVVREEECAVGVGQPWPTDRLGAYFPGGADSTGSSLHPGLSGRRIELYPRRLDACSQELGLDRQALELVVVVHELQHALLHTGWLRERWWLTERLTDSPSAADVRGFLEKRGRVFACICRERGVRAVELHAQLGAWHLLHHSSGTEPSAAEETFLKLMKHQPAEYQLDDELMKSAPQWLWMWMALASEEVMGPAGPAEFCVHNQVSDLGSVVQMAPALTEWLF